MIVSRRLGIDSKSGFYGGFVWARRALNRRKRRFPARAVSTDDYGIALIYLCLMIFPVTIRPRDCDPQELFLGAKKYLLL